VSESTEKREQVIVSLSIPILVEGLSMVRSGDFKSLNEVIEEALRSYAAKRSVSRDRQKVGVSIKRINTLVKSLPFLETDKRVLPLISPSEESRLLYTEPIERSRLTSPIMPITVQKFLPLKLGLAESVIYLRDQKAKHVLLRQLWSFVGHEAESWGIVLGEMDSLSERPRGERLSVAFPRHNDPTGKSMNRFLDSVFGVVLKDGRQSGALPFLGFASLSVTDKEISFGFTREGYDFATLRNPVLNDGENVFPPFSVQERDFLLGHIARRCPTEAEHMRYFIGVLREHSGASRTEMNRHMRTFYERIWNPLELSNSLVDSLRGGVNGRCCELGLTKTTRDGINAYYAAAEAGLRWLDTLRETGG
jgi:hypothetical protein